jgi:glycosyltransferase involved in cell wall biosynthesis
MSVNTFIKFNSSGFYMPRSRVLILADDCNPEWPSLPVVGYKYARALAEVTDATIVTHIRNRENIEKANEITDKVTYVDTEWIARPLGKLSTFLRGGDQRAWSTNQIMAYLPYVFFEREAIKAFRGALDAGEFDIVHRITPMSPALPSYAAGRVRQPFVIGPLNGSLEWPKEFAEEQKREGEAARKLRWLYKYMPYSGSTYRKSDAVLASFRHTIDDVSRTPKERIIPFPEIAFDPDIFHSKGRAIPFSGSGPKRFLFAGRLVPVKVTEAAVRAFATSSKLENHVLHILGGGPEEERLRKIATDHGASERIIFEGQKTQVEVADFMRRCDAFAFPSIKELGAGVVIEAMASGMVCIVVNYGAPGDLVGTDRGVRVELQSLDGMVDAYRKAMEDCLEHPTAHAEMAKRAEAYANGLYTWPAKAEYTVDIYDALLRGEDLGKFKAYV